MGFVEFWSTYWPKWTVKSAAVFVILVIILCFILKKLLFSGKWRKIQVLALGVLTIYLMLVFASAVFTRAAAPDYLYRLEVFWSYRWGMEVYGKKIILEIVLNILMLSPIGVLLPVVIKDKLGTRSVGFWTTIFAGVYCSVLIEILQLILMRGLFEFDDVIHNTVGVIAGYFVWRFMMRIPKMIKSS